MILSNLLLAVTTPLTVEWSPKIAVIMIISNIVAIAFGKWTIKYPSVGPATPAPALFGGFGWPAVLGTASFGHILGAGVILGLASSGAL